MLKNTVVLSNSAISQSGTILLKNKDVLFCDNIVISQINYKPITLPCSSFQSDTTIILQPVIYNLREVVIPSTRKRKRIKVGNLNRKNLSGKQIDFEEAYFLHIDNLKIQGKRKIKSFNVKVDCNLENGKKPKSFYVIIKTCLPSQDCPTLYKSLFRPKKCSGFQWQKVEINDVEVEIGNEGISIGIMMPSFELMKSMGHAKQYGDYSLWNTIIVGTSSSKNNTSKIKSYSFYRGTKENYKTLKNRNFLMDIELE